MFIHKEKGLSPVGLVGGIFDVEMPSERDTLEVSDDGSVASGAAQLLGAN